MEPPCSDKPSMKRGLWSEEEDAKMLEYLSKHGTGKWTSVPKKAGLRRCGKSCRLRWTNYLRPDLKHDNFTSKEEELIIKLHAAIGSRWSMIAQQLPGRTDNDVKNHWNTKLKKKLANIGIDPVTHKPFSQIFADYGSIGGFAKPGMRIASLNKDCLKNNAMVMKKTPNTCPNLSNTLAMPMGTKTEPIQDNFLHHHNNMISKNQPSLDLLAQLQAINLVKEASTTPNLQVEKGTFSSSLSPSSSSSTCSSAAQDFPPNIVPFNWNEFLLEDEFLPNEADQDCQEKEAQVIIESEETSQKLVEGPNCKDNVSDHMVSSNIEANETSFVEALIAKESEMLMEFPDLLGGEFY